MRMREMDRLKILEKEKDLRSFSFFHNIDLSHVYDSLTSVVNRETMIEYIESLIKSKTPFALCLLDVDNFKTVNDTFGHMVGDQVLTQTSHHIADMLGNKGVIGRFGGDEFIIVLEGVSEYTDVWDICHSINVSMGTFTLTGITGLSITTTMGVARYPLNAQNYDGLYSLADKVLYRGKMKGRNCFIIYLEEKHKHLDLHGEKDKGISSTELCSKTFRLLTETANIEENIENLFRYLVSYFMFDHICIETSTKMCHEVMHVLTKNKNFSHVNIRLLDKVVNVNGMVMFNKRSVLRELDCIELVEQFESQQISGSLYCRIAVYGKEYGYIRVDMTDTTRVWQSGEKDLIIMAANTIALMLYLKGESIENFADVPPVTIGEIL
jgi:diguanylate cyclase (GGDEF)-like protein